LVALSPVLLMVLLVLVVVLCETMEMRQYGSLWSIGCRYASTEESKNRIGYI